MLIPVLIGISIVTFSLLRFIPGDPARVMLGEHATAEQVAEFRKRMGLDDPLPIQYIRYLGRIIRGDLGRAIRTNELVTTELAQRLPATVELTLGAMFVACLFGITAGIIAAYYHNSLFDLITMVGALIGVSMPCILARPNPHVHLRLQAQMASPIRTHNPRHPDAYHTRSVQHTLNRAYGRESNVAP
jgi:peptide/nickel transport system permease protein